MITIPPVNDQSLEGVTRMEHEQLIPMMTKLPCHTQPSEGMTIPYHTVAGYDQRDPDSDPPAQLRDGAGFLEAPDPPAPSHYNTKAPPYQALLRPLQCISTFYPILCIVVRCCALSVVQASLLFFHMKRNLSSYSIKGAILDYKKICFFLVIIIFIIVQ